MLLFLLIKVKTSESLPIVWSFLLACEGPVAFPLGRNTTIWWIVKFPPNIE